MSLRLKHLRVLAGLFMAMIAIIATSPAASASAPSSKSILKITSSPSASNVTTNAWPISPPRIFPPDTPCYREEVEEHIYETGQGQHMYTFWFGAQVCIFSDHIYVYEPDSNVTYPTPTGQPDVRLASVAFTVQNTIRPIVPNDIYTYSSLAVTFCPDLPQPSACQQYHHQLGLEFTRGWVYPIGRFDRIA